MNFLRLLNPWRNDLYAGPDGVGRQQLDAGKQFPEEVRRSLLQYWRPGDPVKSTSSRFLVGVAATFSLKDLRFLDILNKSIRDNSPNIVIDVFNIEDMFDARREIDSAWNSYYPGSSPLRATPVIGEWKDGVFCGVATGNHAMNKVLAAVGSKLQAEQFQLGLSPPAPELMEDYEVHR